MPKSPVEGESAYPPKCEWCEKVIVACQGRWMTKGMVSADPAAFQCPASNTLPHRPATETEPAVLNGPFAGIPASEYLSGPFAVVETSAERPTREEYIAAMEDTRPHLMEAIRNGQPMVAGSFAEEMAYYARKAHPELYVSFAPTASGTAAAASDEVYGAVTDERLRELLGRYPSSQYRNHEMILILKELMALHQSASPSADAGTVQARFTVRPISEYHEDQGCALWWKFPICEPPYVGSPLDCDWPGYHTHYTLLTNEMRPIDPDAALAAYRSKTNAQQPAQKAGE